ncbi:SusD/RagB family nutrient-binding outer membrane lipoprotein, partial [Dysgonomonas gadei]
MKKIIFFIFTILVCMTSCNDLEELNKDPNNPTETHPQLLLTQIQWTAFREFQGTSPLYANKMLVQTDGENSYQYYKWNRGDYSYTKMKDISKMMEEAQKINENSYIALGKFFRAYYFYNMALRFGDIPYSEALKGESDNIFAPVYDNQKDVITGILNELEEANTIIENEKAAIKGDIIYNGDTDKW